MLASDTPLALDNVSIVVDVSNHAAATGAASQPAEAELTFERVKPYGSLLSDASATLPFSQADIRRVGFFAEAGSTINFDAKPTAQLLLRLTVRDATSGEAISPTVSSAIRRGAAEMPPVRIPASGRYELEIQVVRNTTTIGTGVEIQAVRNGVLEYRDSTAANPIKLDDAKVNVGGRVSSAIAQLEINTSAIRYNDPRQFIDISSTGQRLDLDDDGIQLIRTPIGNALFPAGPIYINANGGLTQAPGLGPQNGPLRPRVSATLAAFWDDLFPVSDRQSMASVYWDTLTIDGIEALVVQWQDVRHFDHRSRGGVTFQVQLFDEGSVFARFVYKDVHFGSSSVDGGKSATIGVSYRGDGLRSATASVPYTGDGFNQVGYLQSNVVANGDVIDFVSQQSADYFEFSGAAGESVDIVMKRYFGNAIGTPQLKLFGPTGSFLAKGSQTPLVARTTVSNFDIGIIGFTLPQTGTYQARVIGEGFFDYGVTVANSIVFDTENTIGTLAPFRSMAVGESTLGFLTGGDTRDYVTVDLTAGQSIRVVARTPFDEGMNSPTNTLEMAVYLRGPDRTVVASDTITNVNGDLTFNFTASKAGSYGLDLRRVGGFGEYVVHVIDTSSAAARLLAPVGQVGTAVPNEFLNNLTGTWPVGEPSASGVSLAYDLSGNGRPTALDAIRVSTGIAAQRSLAVDEALVGLDSDDNDDANLQTLASDQLRVGLTNASLF